MTGEGARNGNGYEHAGGYQPDASLWPSPRDIVFGVAYGVSGSVTMLLLDELAPGAPGKQLFFLIICVAAMSFGVWEFFRADRLDPEEEVANPMSVLYPERIEDDAKARRRRRRTAATIVAAGSLAGVVYCLQALLETGVAVTNIAEVILVFAAFLFIPFLLGVVFRRRQSSPE